MLSLIFIGSAKDWTRWCGKSQQSVETNSVCDILSCAQSGVQGVEAGKYTELFVATLLEPYVLSELRSYYG
jgi:hypothetical protein